jgi:hypothetical protein
MLQRNIYRVRTSIDRPFILDGIAEEKEDDVQAAAKPFIY